MKLNDMSDMQIHEMTLRWDIEYFESYLASLLAGEVSCTPEELPNEIKYATDAIEHAKLAHYNHLIENGEHFI